MLNLIRPSVVLFAVALVTGGFGIVLYNVDLAALAIALPYHYTGTFMFNWVAHLGPIYVATLVFVIGALLSLRAVMQST